MVATLEPHLSPGQCVVDTSTSSVALTREIGARLAARGIGYADAPVARTREAAARGELSIMVGATDAVFAHIRPVLETMGTDVTHCGPVGCGQVVKILNNMLVFQHTAALAEAIAIGRRNGVPPEMLLPTIAKGSGDSFVLRSHGMKSMLPRDFPERAFSTRYAIKDLSYALEMADGSGAWRCREPNSPCSACASPRQAGNGETLPSGRAARDRPSMSTWPMPPRWCEACAEDAVLAAWRGPWSVAFAVDSDGATTTFAFADGSLAGGGVPQFTLAAPAAVWAKFLEPVPPRHHHAIFAMLARVPEFSVRGDQLAFLQHCHVVRRVLEIGKWLALGNAAPVPASLHPPLGIAHAGARRDRRLCAGDRRRRHLPRSTMNTRATAVTCCACTPPARTAGSSIA